MGVSQSLMFPKTFQGTEQPQKTEERDVALRTAVFSMKQRLPAL